MIIPFNDNWLFTEYFDAGFADAVPVRLPHTAKEISYNYADCSSYQFVCGYKKLFFSETEWCGKRLLLRFEGAAHEARVFINGSEAGRHSCGYTAFTLDITDLVRLGEENELCVRLDTRESLNVPPFGFVIDYLCYGGLYREVYLELRDSGYIKGVRIENTALNEIRLSAELSLELSGRSVKTDILDANGAVEATAMGPAADICLPKGKLWTPDSPYLYTARVRVIDREQRVYDEKCLRFGLRTAEFRADGFYLNGERLKLRGLNRHQSYAYVGYAMPRSMQYLDAEILKNELCVNAVRTSHYPQSQHFYDACDELGLLVFTEIPGWQHIGNSEWQRAAIKNTEAMVLQNMHHPSVILWGVRINESQDCNELYRETNRIAHELDCSRQTSGVRCLEKSRLLEDVYAYNDFSHKGDNRGLKDKRSVTPNRFKPYLISECNGHIFPTKPYDDERHRLEHALRHVNVLDAAYAAEDICGIFTWCMFDYNTHKDFGSGDGICYHGVADMFRNPKLAAAVYSSQSDGDVFCEVSSGMDIGEHPGGDIGRVYVFTNADSVRLYKNGCFVREFLPDREKYASIPHPPVVIDDFIGELLAKNEGYDKSTADELKDCLYAIAKYGPSGLPPKYLFKLGRLMLTKGLRISDGYELYGKYIGNWGSEATEWKFAAVRDGVEVKETVRKAGLPIHLEFKVSSSTLREDDTYDAAEVRIEARDALGTKAVYYSEPLMLRTEGAIELIGPEVISLKGGAGGVYVRSKREKGRGTLYIGNSKIEFNVE